MTFDPSGFLLEGIRVAPGDNQFTYPPRTLISNQILFDASPGRAEYLIFVGGQTISSGIDIADPNLIFIWTKNSSNITRFDIDAFSRKWSPSFGSAPEVVGSVQNTPRLTVPIPNLDILSEAPYQVYLDLPRLFTFTISLVSSSSSFSNPPAGIVEISSDLGEVNFGSADLSNPAYSGLKVYLSRQNFFDRSKTKGNFGFLPKTTTSSYDLYINPIPGVGQTPRIRIGYRRYLNAIVVATESLLTVPPAGSCHVSRDTGKILFSLADISSFPGETVFYDGVVFDQVSFVRGTVGSSVPLFPTPVGTRPEFIGLDDPFRFVLYGTPPSKPRYYLQTAIQDSTVSPLTTPLAGTAVIDKSNGDVYVSSDDSNALVGSGLFYIDSYLSLENGVSVQFFRSGANSSGFSQVSDFVENYLVTNQVIQPGLSSSPFVFLPTTPLIDSSLVYTTGPGSGAGSAGALVDGTDSTKLGLGYLLNLDSKQLKFSNRKNVSKTLDKASSIIKLDDAAISLPGLKVTKNSVTITSGIDFDFNPSFGLIEFIEPVGENDPNNILNLSGSITLPNKLTSTSVFSGTSLGKSIFIQSGSNVGLYTITTILDANNVIVSQNFTSAGFVVFDIRDKKEVIIDRFWTQLNPPFKKLTVSKSTSISGLFTPLTNSEFSVLADKGQVNFVTPASPGDITKITYISQNVVDDLPTTPIPVTEFAGFKIRQETATVIPNTKNATFNPLSKTVLTTQPLITYLNGVTLDQTLVTFTPPNKLELPAKLSSTDSVVVDYFIAESPGGNINFLVSKPPMDVDFPVVTSGQSDLVLNGNQTSLISSGSALLLNTIDIALVNSLSYDSSSDQTTLKLVPTPSVDSTGPIYATGPINNSYQITETNPVDLISQNTNRVFINGQVNYPTGTIVTIDGDPFSVLSSSFQAGKTVLTLTTNVIKNYILPVLTKTIRPVIFPTDSVQTSKPAHLGYPFTLVKSGTSMRILRKDIDYSVSEGGSIQLNLQVGFGDSLDVLYVARMEQPVGTVFTFNYAYEIAPDSNNGLIGKKLLSTYNLYSPDSFYFRVESVQTFAPELAQDIISSLSSGASGPNISSATSTAPKDYGNPSLFFNEQHIGNIDVVSSRLLKFYNDEINIYEDILANFDGRSVGGTSGRLRFDGKTDNPARTLYSEVTNDIDDQIKIFDKIELTGFFTFTSVPVYAPIWQPGPLSRFFPTASTLAAALNGSVGVADYGKALGSIGTSNITSANTFTSTRAVSKFTKVNVTGTIFEIPLNGSSDNLIPKFVATQEVRVYSSDGTPDVIGTVASVTGSGPYNVTLSVPTLLKSGSLASDVSSSIPINHFYVPNRDIGLNNDNGQLINIFTGSLLQVPIIGNEIIDTPITFTSTNTAPNRFPALDGSIFIDSGRPSIPQLTYPSELDLYDKELSILSGLGSAKVAGDFITITSATVSASVGQFIIFTTGPNAGFIKSVSTVISPTSFTITPLFSSSDPIGNSFYIVPPGTSLASILTQEFNVLNNNAVVAPISPALIGSLDSQIKSADSLIQNFGSVSVSGLGSVTSLTLTDTSKNFVTNNPPITNKDFVYISSGSNHGLYKIASVTATTTTIDPVFPYSNFPSPGPVSYSIIKLWDFVSTKGPDFASEFIRNTISFYNSTQVWASSITESGKSARVTSINTRKTDVTRFVGQVQSLLSSSDNLYDSRFLWITQRIDRKLGTLTRKTQAVNLRLEATQSLITNQKKLLIISTM